MNGAYRAALLAAVAGQLGVALPTAVAAGSEVAAELAQCAAIAAADARLVCYDKRAGRAADRTAPAVASAAAPSASATLAATLAQMPATIAPAAAPAVPPVPADDPRNFGLAARQTHTAQEGPKSIQARVAQASVDQLRHSYVVLDNGQAWASTEGGMLVDSGELVTISRAALGSFMLTSASKHSYHVRRIR